MSPLTKRGALDDKSALKIITYEALIVRWLLTDRSNKL